jgi:twitching motility protein PilT
MPSLHQLLKQMIDRGASDLHITAGAPAQLRVDGGLRPVGTASLSGSETKELCYSILTDQQRQRFEEDRELDLSFGIRGLSRFRANVYVQKGAVAGAFRTIPYNIPAMDELGLPGVVPKLCNKPRGLVLVTGPTGSGKSTTLASMIDRINRSENGHILTIEDPIEYLHQHRKCLVNQREVGSDTASFKGALRYVLRQDPDVVLIGEMRDIETVEAALTVSETGHLVFATLHTNSCVQTINRIIDVFPPYQQPQVRAQLSFVLEGVISQQLLARIGGGRALAAEVMVPNMAIRNMIRDEKIHMIHNAMQAGQERSGMCTMNQALLDLYQEGKISLDDTIARCSDPEEMRAMMANAGIDPTGGASMATAVDQPKIRDPKGRKKK